MRELVDELKALNERWYQSDIDSDEYAAKVADITARLEWHVRPDHSEFCVTVCVCD